MKPRDLQVNRAPLKLTLILLSALFNDIDRGNQGYKQTQRSRNIIAVVKNDEIDLDIHSELISYV